MKWGDRFRDRSTGVTFETEDFKVTAACASGYTEVEQILPEDELAIDQMQGQERSAGSSPHGSLEAVCRKRMSGTSSDGTDEDDQGETCFSDSLPPGGIRSSRKRPKERRQSPARKNMKTAEVEKEMLMLENGKNRAELAQDETTQSLIPMPVRIVIFAIFVFVIFMHVINGV
ncbi:uncharacterized protein WM294_012400 isoform 1-T5 [Sarcoramphus papa]